MTLGPGTTEMESSDFIRLDNSMNPVWFSASMQSTSDPRGDCTNALVPHHLRHNAKKCLRRKLHKVELRFGAAWRWLVILSPTHSSRRRSRAYLVPLVRQWPWRLLLEPRMFVQMELLRMWTIRVSLQPAEFGTMNSNKTSPRRRTNERT